MPTRKRAQKPPTPEQVAAVALEGKRATVYVERAGACIKIDDVPASLAGVALWQILRTFRELGRTHPELREGPDVVPGGVPIDVSEDEWADEGSVRPRRVGF
jgi:hypothetical protein